MKAQVLTANRTQDGAPLYWNGDTLWSQSIDEATVFSDKAEAEAALGLARQQESYVCDPYLLKVKYIDGAIEIGSQRETIRSAGTQVLLGRLGYPVGDGEHGRQQEG